MKAIPAFINDQSELVWKQPVPTKILLSKYRGKSVNVKLEIPSKSTTNPQYGYLFGVVLKELSDYTGYTKDEMLDILKQKYHFKIAELNGEVFKVGKSISRKKSEMTDLKELIDNAIILGAEIGLIISPPEGENKWWV